MQTKNIAIILASGSGVRFRSEIPKQLLKVAGKRILEHTLDCFQSHGSIDEIIIVGSLEQTALMEEIVLRGGYSKVSRIVLGGDTRQASCAAGIAAIQGDEHKVLVHDAVRPLLDAATISRCLRALDTYDCVDTGIPSPDTVVQTDSDGCIAHIPERSTLRLGQTPQGFRSRLLRQAHALAAGNPNVKVTDDCGLVLHYGLGQVALVDGNVSNIKITYPSDIYLADRIFQLRSHSSAHFKADYQQLEGKTLVVFGASRGIGESLCDFAHAKGARVVALSRAQGVDVTDAVAVRQALHQVQSEFGRIDFVAVTAAVLRTGLLSGQDYADIDEQLATNLKGSIVVAKEAFPLLQQYGGSIALFTSSSYTRGRPRYSVYSATKAAIVNLVQALSEEFAPFGVRINTINPERTATPMRTENFGTEPSASLLDASAVAQATLQTLLSHISGEVVDVRL